ncbi:MAG: DUF1653 domain-containing protein [Paraperlucidibaca sp.]
MTKLVAPTLTRGIYQHYKGPYYEVLDVVRHSETEEWLVYYRTCYGDWSRWVRPYGMFVETIIIADIARPRFTYVAAKLETLGLVEPKR